MSHSHLLDFNEVMCTENKEKKQKMNDRERERERERERGRGWKVNKIYDIIVTT